MTSGNQPWPVGKSANFDDFPIESSIGPWRDLPAQVGKMGLLSVQFPKTLSRVLNTARQLNRRAAGPGAMHDWICTPEMDALEWKIHL